MEPKNKQLPDLLEEHGMSKAAQRAALMRAAAVDPSEFEGDYEGPGTYESVHPLLKAIGEERSRELKVKKAYEN
jgi:hypothetical protein